MGTGAQTPKRLLLNIRNIIIVILTPIVLLPLILFVDGNETKCAYCIIIMAVFWITEALPIAVTSLLPIILFPMVGLLYAKHVSEKYINDTSALFLGGLIMAAAIEYWNIHKRLALRVLMFVGSEPRWLMLGMMLPTWFLSMWISNTATTAMMIPIANAVLSQLKESQETKTDDITVLDDIELEVDVNKKHSNNGNLADDQEKHVVHDAEKNDDTTRTNDAEFLRLCKALSLAIAYSANCGGVASLTGTGPNVIMKGAAENAFQERNATSPITFATWMQYCLPISAIIVVLVWIWLQILFLRCKTYNRKSPEQAKRVSSIIRKQYEDLGPITTVTDSTPAILISISLFIFPSVLPHKFKEKGKPLPALLPWKAAEKMVPWGVVLLLGGGFALAKGSEESGLSKWIGEQLTVFKDFEPWVMNLVLCFIVAAATEVTSNTAICTLMMPIMKELAITLKVNPLYFMFPTAIATSFAFMLPVATPPNAVVFSYGYVKVFDMVKAGFLLNIIAVFVLVFGTETWGEAIFGFHTLPDVFRLQENSTIIANNTTTMLPLNGTIRCV
ncbi:solute carrier family 13 member 2-like isoform X2 [Ostrea edulis]|uniref:solute carrier family 13 member 2-like isoform X2 n=1 Tax=Ostrea edulis TaxID=37623 RepID=UPI0020943F8F|nr:solute carrier family 13 member 2-like isoform X2 [Ostrea edulis]